MIPINIQETLTPPGHLVSPLGYRGPWMSTVVLYCWCHSDDASVLLYFTFLSHLFPLPCGAGSTVPREGFDSSVIMPFPGVLWLWHFLYSIGPHPMSSLHIYTFVVSRAFMAGAASQAGDADSSRAPGLTSGLQGSMNVHSGALLLVPQWRCISSFVFYIQVSRSKVKVKGHHDLQHHVKLIIQERFASEASNLVGI